MNRKLIRPNLSEFKEKPRSDQAKKKPHPAFETFAENYYYLKQMNKKIPMVIVLTDGEVIAGQVEWYDRDCIKLNRSDAPNLLIYKHSIKYLYKVEDATEASAPESKRTP
jgi:sRNA-binding regulator protein Hfq